MTPDVSQFLLACMQRMIGEIAPRLESDYLQGTTSTLAILMMFAATEFGRAADVRASENTQMRRLFARAARALPDGELKERCSEAARGKDGALTVAALESSNSDLRRLLITLHAFVEEADKPWARALDRAIWQVLKTSAERRFFYLPPM